MDWIRISFLISLVEDPDLNPSTGGFEFDFQKRSKCLLEEVDLNPPTQRIRI